MKNKQKFAKEIIDLAIKDETIAVDKYTNKVVICDEFECCDCLFNTVEGYCVDKRSKWAEEEYVEPTVDWSKVPVDTPILVSDDGVSWYNRHFAKYTDGIIYAWNSGRTSWTSEDVYIDKYFIWRYVKLAETEESNNEKCNTAGEDK